MKRFLIILTILLHTCYGYVSLAQQRNISKYSIEDGLVHNDVLNIYQDSQGFLWICTRGGLSRYDGSRFTNYTLDNGLTNDMINDIYEIAPQEFIVAQNMKGLRLLKNDTIVSLSPNNTAIVNKFYQVNNELLAATDHNGLLKFEKNNFIPVDPASKHSIQDLAMPNDSVWLMLCHNVSLQLMTPLLQPWSPVTRLDATMIFTDSHHRTWVGTTHGLRLLAPVMQPGRSIAFMALPQAFDLPILRESSIGDFMEDSQANCWIGTNKGLVLVSPDGRSNIFNERDGLPASSINCIREDRQNNIWIGTILGLAKFSLNNEIKIFAQNQGLSTAGPVFISPVAANRLQLFDGKNISNLDLITGRLTKAFRRDSSGYSIYKLNKEELLVTSGTRGTIYHRGEEQGEMISWPTIGLFSVIRIGPRDFIGAYVNKLFLISNGNAVEKLTVGAADNICTLLPDKEDCIWVGTQDSGLYKIKIDRKHHPLSLEIIDTLAGRLPDQHIRALYADRENELWIGTRYKGVIRVLDLQHGKYEIQNYGTHEGLSSDFVKTINRDKKGNIWVGTMQGLSKLIPVKNQYRVFNFGRINKVFSQVYDIIFLHDNYLLTTGYPSLVHALDMQQDTLPPPAVYITKIFTGLKDSSSISYSRQTRLPYNKAQIYFEFSAPQFINEAFTEYSYRLSGGNDTNWTIAEKSHSVYFASLQPGNYTFSVRAMGFNGEWGQPAIHHFIVTKPFWQKAWFIALIVVVLAGLIYALYRYRILQLIRLQKVRNRIANDLHDEIGSTLTNISILSNLSQRNLADPRQANNFLQRISEEVSSSSQALDDIIWSVNTNHDTLEEIVSRMRRYAAELFDSANIRYDLYLDPVFEGKKMIMEQRRDMYLLYKEAVNNIFKHAEAKQVTIKIAVAHNQLVLDIKDDGKGFDTLKESGRHGLAGMKNRVKKWNGKMQVESAEGKGTTIRCRFPLST